MEMADGRQTAGKPWAVLQHVAHEGPGLIAAEAKARGLNLRMVQIYRNDQLPDPADLGGLIVMGGPMGVRDRQSYPGLAAELELIVAAVADNLPVLGVCLGAQLLAAALGAEVYRGHQDEIGAGWVRLTRAGASDPVLGLAQGPLPVFHWHRDTFDLPSGAVHLAASDLYRNQAFRAASCAYGLQFHIELDSRLAAQWQPHLSPGLTIDNQAVAAIAAVGKPAIGRFFDQALVGVGPVTVSQV